MGQSMGRFRGISIMEQYYMDRLRVHEYMNIKRLTEKAKEYAGIIEIEEKETDYYDHIHRQILINKNIKVYAPAQRTCGSVWFELDLGQGHNDEDGRSSIKVRKMPWVCAADSKPNCKAVCVGSSIYLLGGETVNHHHCVYELHNDVFYLDHGANQFEVGDSMLSGHLLADRMLIVVLQSKIYVLSDHGEVFDPDTRLWNRFEGPSFDPYLRRTLGSYSDSSNNRILVYFCCDNGYPLYEYRPGYRSSWTCINSNFMPSIRIGLSVLVDDFIIAHLEDSSVFVAYDLCQHKWSPLKWKSDGRLDASLFGKSRSWSSLLHLGEGTLLMLRTMPHQEAGCKHYADDKIRVDCLTFKVAKSYFGAVLASKPTAKSVVLEGTFAIEEFISP